MHEPLLKVISLSKCFAGVVASDQLSLEVGAGELHAVIGPNGAGKTTLLNQLAGETRPELRLDMVCRTRHHVDADASSHHARSDAVFSDHNAFYGLQHDR